MIRIVLNYQKFYKMDNVTRIFKLLGGIIGRFNDEMANVDATEETRDQLRSVNLLEVLTKMEFLSTFDLYFKS